VFVGSKLAVGADKGVITVVLGVGDKLSRLQDTPQLLRARTRRS